MARNPVVPVRYPTTIIERLERAAEQDDRTISQQVRRYVREGLSRDGYLPMADPSPPKHRA